MGGIDEAALDRLALVTELTRRIRVRTSGTVAVAATAEGKDTIPGRLRQRMPHELRLGSVGCSQARLVDDVHTLNVRRREVRQTCTCASHIPLDRAAEGEPPPCSIIHIQHRHPQRTAPCMDARHYAGRLESWCHMNAPSVPKSARTGTGSCYPREQEETGRGR